MNYPEPAPEKPYKNHGEPNINKGQTTNNDHFMRDYMDNRK